MNTVIFTLGTAPMTDLSPAAQALLDAAAQAMECDNEFIPYERELMAAALRAAADQVAPEFWHEDDDIYGETMQDIRKKLFTIADELGGIND